MCRTFPTRRSSDLGGPREYESRSFAKLSMTPQLFKNISFLPLALVLVTAWPAAAQVPPTVSFIDPAPDGTLLELSQINITFSVAVVGVDASDLLINGVPTSN